MLLRARFVLAVLAPAAFAPFAAAQAPTANAYVQHNLVSDIPGMADVTDANLVDPWGLSISTTSPFWVSNAGKGVSTLYNGSGTITPLVVTIASAPNGPTPSKPTGQVFNSTSGFILANGNKASFIFDGLDGTITAWNGGATAAVMVDNSASASYTGLAIGSNSSGPLLYAANFKTGKIDVFDGKFAPATVAGGFVDSAIPSGYGPFNIWNLGGKLYVTYAAQSAGVGNGYVSVFDMDGNLIKHLVSQGPLNNPWGVAIAPSTFGAFAGALIVGNFGDGFINAFDLNTGKALGTLQDTNGKPIQIPGLWALVFGNGKSGGDTNMMYFTAGINGEKDGLLGSISPPATVINAYNAASGATGGIAPGECIFLSGISIGPSPLVSGKFPATGTLATSLSSTSVTINGVPAPILYASASQTAVMVPYEIAGSSTANIVVTYKDQTTKSFQVPVATTAPALFTADSSGSGQAVAFNQDGTLNSSKNPASVGQVVVLIGTGEGVTNPVLPDGQVISDILATAQAPVTMTIGGQTAQVIYAGSSPGSIAGVLQVEAIVPRGAGTGAVPVVLNVGSGTSQKSATISLQ
ncbi:MAG TPA: TIGR03118 family protein [Bryobacteraceae bacterium]|nr:TIGR03118 family protein [Bryobacteraceae bacterium]